MAPGPTQPPIQWLPGAFPREVKRPGREVYHSPPSSAEVKKSGAIPPLLNIFFMVKVKGKVIPVTGRGGP
jgi:hypothetical protein